ncbi:PREDICTED: uncharacterized protein LOC104601352 [Nelumbo nucifera]|uniref:Uncharacterized protein LOC104601352 n=1 Tax=Nelumbo nucifera TaxID=4432 RepID=A0A1U8A8I3_NELNU|nr:PREDICTED: uncharacterized protein LOC104601352 [Nelumbo nucifera]
MATEVQHHHHQQQQLDRVGGTSGGVEWSGGTPITDAGFGGVDGCYVTTSVGLAHPGRNIPVTLDLFHSKLASSSVELQKPSPPLPLGWQKLLDPKTGVICYTSKDTQSHSIAEAAMSRNGKSPKLDLKLNLSPPRANPQVESPDRSSSPSPPSSCVSSEQSPEQTHRNSNSPEATSMVLVGCPRCLMYVMLSEDDPKCPKCKSTVLLDFLNDNNNSGSSSKNTKKTRKN